MIRHVLPVSLSRHADVVLDHNFHVVSELCCIENEHLSGGMTRHCVSGAWLAMDHENGNPKIVVQFSASMVCACREPR